MYNPLSDESPRTNFVPEQIKYKQQSHAIGHNRIRRLAKISGGGAGPYSDGSDDIEITIPGRQLGKLIEGQNIYLVADFKNSTANPIYFQGKLGSAGIFESIYVKTSSGKNISGFNNHNVLMSVELAKHASTEYLLSVGNELFGTTLNDIAGTEIPARANNVDGSIRKVIPICLSNFAREFPLWGDEDIIFTCKLADSRTTYVGANTLVAGTVKLYNMQCIYETVDLQPEIYKSYVNAMDNTYIMSGSDWYSTVATIPAATSGISFSIPINRKAVKRIIAVIRKQDNIPLYDAVSVCSRNIGGFTEAYLALNGVTIPSTTLKLTPNSSCAEMMAELMINNGSLLNLSSSCLNMSTAPKTVIATITSPAVVANNSATIVSTDETIYQNLYGQFHKDLGDAKSNAECGQFFYEFNLQTGLEDNDKTYSGLPVFSNNLTVNFMNGVTSINYIQTVNIFVEYQVDYVLANNFWNVLY